MGSSYPEGPKKNIYDNNDNIARKPTLLQWPFLRVQILLRLNIFL